MWWLVAKLNEQASSTGHPLQTRGTFFLQRMFWHCTINSRSFNLKSCNKKSSVTYCFNILKKWSESCQNVLILQILQCRRCQLQYIFKRLQANLNEVWWIIMVPFLIPSLVNLHFGKAHLASWTNQLMVLQVDQINSFCWPNNWSSFCSENLNKLKGANADKVLKICQGKMGQISVPNSCLSADLQASFCRLRVVSTIEAPGTQKRRGCIKIWPESKKDTLNLFIQKKMCKT